MNVFVKYSNMEWKIKIIFSFYLLMNNISVEIPDDKSDCKKYKCELCNPKYLILFLNKKLELISYQI